MGNMTYEYHLHTWGGFYNKAYQEIHGEEEGDKWFDTRVERQEYIDHLKKIEAKLGAKELAYTTSEGYNCRIRTVLHRVIEYRNVRYSSEYDMGVNFPYDAAAYHLEYKWRPGFNDYPLGEEFDYDAGKFKIIQEWITGAFGDSNNHKFRDNG